MQSPLYYFTCRTLLTRCMLIVWLSSIFGRSAQSLADFQFPLLPWEKFGFVEPRAAVHAVLGQAGVKSAHGVTVRVGVTEEYFEGAFVNWHNEQLSISASATTSQLIQHLQNQRFRNQPALQNNPKISPEFPSCRQLLFVRRTFSYLQFFQRATDL
jgi:hypothetical protein